MWAAKNKPTLFVAVEAIGQVKASVHCPDAERLTWKRHYGFDYDAKGEVADAARSEGGSRHQATWNGADIGKGRTIEWRIIVPGGALRLTPLSVSSDVKLLSPPRTTQWLIIAVILGPRGTASDYPRAQDTETHLLSEGQLCDGRHVWITYCYTTAKQIVAPSNQHPRLLGSLEQIRSAPSELRASAIANNSDGSLVFWDCRVENKLSKHSPDGTKRNPG